MRRRQFLAMGAGSMALLGESPARLGLAANQNSRLRLLQIGAGGIGALDRRELLRHPKVEFVGFCDVDSRALDAVAVDFPHAFRLADYREAFAQHGERFDAVVVDTPDFHHATMILTALHHGKHVYGQKPLVHQLEELKMVREAVAARPDLVTQMGNQRASVEGRMQAVEMLRSHQLGRPIEAHVWTGKMERSDYFAAPWSERPQAQPLPPGLHWDLWNGPLTTPFPYSDEVAPRRWRAFWDTGTGQLGDWGCHLIDVLYYAYGLASPIAVQTNTIRPSGVGHSGHNQSTLTYPGGDRFAGERFLLHYNDGMIWPSFASLGLPAMRPGYNQTLIVCEEGTMLLGDLGRIDIFREGKRVENEPLPEVEPHDHWGDWVERCLGSKKAHWSPFSIASRISEPALLAVKATRFPNTELRWDGENYRFIDHPPANREVVRRDYREGFGPPSA